jgi:hypothetical protein
MITKNVNIRMNIERDFLAFCAYRHALQKLVELRDDPHYNLAKAADFAAHVLEAFPSDLD